METDYAPTDLSVKRREYEINMLLLFRDVQNKHFQKQLPMNLDLHHLDSYKRLVAFVNNIPARDEKYQASRRRFTKEKGFFSEERGNYLTELAVYWRSRPDKVEMMEYKEVWEVVAQRPLAWELLPPGWQPSVTNERRSTITRDSTAKHSETGCWPQKTPWNFGKLSMRIAQRVSAALGFGRASDTRP